MTAPGVFFFVISNTEWDFPADNDDVDDDDHNDDDIKRRQTRLCLSGPSGVGLNIKRNLRRKNLAHISAENLNLTPFSLSLSLSPSLSLSLSH